MPTQALLIIFGVAATLFFVLLATYWLWLPALLQSFAKNNFLITSVEEGTAKAIMRYGEFDRFVMSWRGYYLSKNWDIIKEGSDEAGRPENAKVPPHPMDKFLPGGLRWVGWPFANKVYCYHFQWTSIRQGSLGTGVQTARGIMSIIEQGKLEDLMVFRDETPDYIFLKRDVYGITFQDTDDKDMIPLKFITLLTAQVVNPYRALFGTQQWLEQITNFLRRYIKEYVGKNTLIDLVTDANNGTQKESREILGYLSPNDKPFFEYVLEEWGVRIDHVNLVNFKTAGQRGAAYEEAAATRYVKQQDAEGIRQLAAAERDRIKTIADGEVYKIEKIAAADASRITTVAKAVTEGGEDARTVKTLETYEVMSEHGTVFVMGGKNPTQMLLDSTRTKKSTKPETKKEV